MYHGIICWNKVTVFIREVREIINIIKDLVLIGESKFDDSRRYSEYKQKYLDSSIEDISHIVPFR